MMPSLKDEAEAEAEEAVAEAVLPDDALPPAPSVDAAGDGCCCCCCKQACNLSSFSLRTEVTSSWSNRCDVLTVCV